VNRQVLTFEVDRFAAEQSGEDDQCFVETRSAITHRLTERLVLKFLAQTDAEQRTPVGQVIQRHHFTRHHLWTASRKRRHDRSDGDT
jgi:hypothetical protein